MIAMRLDDTITAIATPPGVGGIAIIRLSGSSSHSILARVVRRRHGQINFPSHRLVYGHAYHPQDKDWVDEVMAVFMAAPQTYTREDMAEIHCHGGPLPAQRVLDATMAAGARLATPGEFTLRAFLHGRLSLEQAEAVLDVINAQTNAALTMALSHLEGSFGRQVRAIRRQVLEALAYLTARADFVDDEIPEREIRPSLESAQMAIHNLLRTADTGILLRQGAQVAIVGRPNVGKSSLLNALLRQNRAIVTPIPGTTRDTLEETINLQGLPVVLIDTAGLRDTEDVGERLGVERTAQAMARADVLLIVLDASQPLTPDDVEIAQRTTGRRRLLALNKSDLTIAVSADALRTMAPDCPIVSLSAVTGAGLHDLEDALVRLLMHGQNLSAEAVMITNPRHRDALRRADTHVADALAGLGAGRTEDVIGLDVTAAAAALGEITGETVTDDLLATIFSQFCIGK